MFNSVLCEKTNCVIRILCDCKAKVKNLDEKKYNERHIKEYIMQADEEDFICVFYKKSLKSSEMHLLIVQH